jgi:beta-ribofuranosylaminobenzene 5'-phosphate synthase
MSSDWAESIEISTPSRIHVTLIDMNGSTGRRDGSVGFAVNAPRLILRAQRGPVLRCVGPVSAQRRRDICAEVSRAAALVGVSDAMEIEVISDIPEHTGLGSGTQLRLAVLTAVARLASAEPGPGEVVARSGRGGTSGIGIHSFHRGGFLVDGGHRCRDKPEFAPSRFADGGGRQPPLLFAADPPDRWRVVLALPDGPAGLAGQAEYDFMKANTPLPLDEVRQVSHLVLMGLLPALVEEDLAGFGRAIAELQDVGWKRRHWQRPDLREWRPLVEVLVAAGAAGAGLSSTGPLVYGVFDRSTVGETEIIERTYTAAQAAGLPLRWVRATGFGARAQISTTAGSGGTQ